MCVASRLGQAGLENDMPRAIFAAEASPSIGGGHVMRSLALARVLLRRGWQCELAARPVTFATFPASTFEGLGKHNLGEVEASPDQFAPNLPDVIVFDRYAALTTVEAAWQAAGTTVAVIDDLADQNHHADLLLNQNQPDLTQRYAGLLPAECITLFGPDFALLRPEFAAARKSALARHSTRQLPQRVFVSFGLTDPPGGCLLTIDALERAKLPVEVHVAIGAAARDTTELQMRAQRSELDIIVHIDTPELANIMAECDYAIAAGGSSAWERCAVGLPSIVMSISENQHLSCAFLEVRGAALNLGQFSAVTVDTLVACIKHLHTNVAQQRSIALAASMVCDGDGAERVADGIEAARGNATTPRSVRPEA